MEVIKNIIKHNMEKRKLLNKKSIKFAVLLLFVILQNYNAQSLNSPDMSSSNQALNLINVSIGGDFPVNGTYLASRTERVDQLITKLINEYKSELLRITPDKKLLNLIKKNSNEYSKRNIILKRFNGEVINIDLIKFRVTGNFKYNPYMENDDIIIFPPLDIETNFISISGAVNKETKFQFVQSDKLSDAILFAHGINKAYPKIERIEITRLSFDGNDEQIINLNDGDDYNLLPGDRIKVISEETYRRDYRVLIVGEVNNPGYVNVKKDGEKIEEVINKAGGLLEDAWKDRIQVYKGYYSKLNTDDKYLFDEVELKKISDYRKYEGLLMNRMSNLFYYDTAYFNLENDFRFFNSNGIITYNQMLSDTSDIHNIMDGDYIVVPKFRNSIYLIGQVPNPGEYKFVKGQSYLSYIENAGGFGEYSTEYVMLVKGNNREWISIYDKEVEIEPGDYIYVPKERLRDFGFYLSRVGSIAGIVGSIATIYLLLIQIGK